MSDICQILSMRHSQIPALILPANERKETWVIFLKHECVIMSMAAWISPALSPLSAKEPLIILLFSTRIREVKRCKKGAVLDSRDQTAAAMHGWMEVDVNYM